MENILFDSYFMHRFMIKEEIGQGAFGKVFKCVNKSSGEEIALKVISKTGLSKAQLKRISFEGNILNGLDHPNIVKLKELYESKFYFMLEMELLSGGNLEDRLKTQTFTDDESALVMKELMSAVEYLHNNDIIHRDIKPENIMFKGEGINRVKLADFGLSSQCTLEEGADDSCGTAVFMAPEQAGRRVYNKPVDIWSCGIVMFILITGKHPLSQPGDTIESYFNRLKHFEWKFPNGFSKLAQDLFIRLTKIDPLQRYTADLALRHPWITRQSEMPAPLTYLERLNSFNDKLKARKITAAVLILSSLLPPSLQSRIEYQEMPQIQLKFNITHSKLYRETHKRHVSMILTHRSPSPVTKPKHRQNSAHKKSSK